MTDPNRPDRIPVTVLTGFLGAGKTTLLNRLLADPRFADTAVVVNQLGAVGIDAHLVETAGERAFAQTTGCLCCTVAGDVRLTLLRFAEDAANGRGPRFARLVIETTGLADPAPVLQALMTSDLVIDRYALNGVVTVVDATSGEATLARFREARAQAAGADLIAVSKTDLAGEAMAGALTRRLATLAPNAAVIAAPEARPEAVFGLAAFDPRLKPPEVARWLRFAPPPGHGDGHAHHPHGHGHPHGHDPARHHPDIAAFAFAGAEPVNAWDVQDAIEALQERLGVDLLRLKAIVRLDEDPGTPVVLHAVQRVLHPPARLAAWPAGAQGTRMVVIARGERGAEVPAILARHLPRLARIEATDPAPAAR